MGPPNRAIGPSWFGLGHKLGQGQPSQSSTVGNMKCDFISIFDGFVPYSFQPMFHETRKLGGKLEERTT